VVNPGVSIAVNTDNSKKTITANCLDSAGVQITGATAMSNQITFSRKVDSVGTDFKLSFDPPTNGAIGKFIVEITLSD